MDSGWDRILAGLETFLTFFFIFGSKVDVPMDENCLSHNALTRRMDPRYPEGPWILFKAEVDFGILNFQILGPWAQGPGPRAHGPMGPWARAKREV